MPSVATAPYTAKVNGSLVEVEAGGLNVTNQIGQRSTGTLQVRSALGVKWKRGTQVQIYDDVGALAYSGYVAKDRVQRSPGARQGSGYLEHTLTLMDNCYRADKRVIFKSYLNVTAGFIAQDLVNRVLYQEGVTYTASSIASGVTVPEVIWWGKQISQALDWLAKNSGYWWNIDTNGVLWFQPYAGVPAPFSIDGSETDSMGNLAVEFGNDLYVNTQYTKGGYAEKGSKSNKLHETLYGNGTTRSFTLSYPVSKIYQILLNGVDVTAQSLTKGSSGGSYYYAPGDAVIAQDPSQTILSNTDHLDVDYTGRVPAIGVAQSSSLIAAQKAIEGGGSGIVESVYSDTKVHTLPAALQIASALLAHYGADMVTVTFDTRYKGLLEGQQLIVSLADYGLSNAATLIMSVAIDDNGPTDSGVNIWYHVTAVGSPVDAAQFQTFWQNLMNQQSDPTDLSDTSDQQFTPIVTSTFSHSPSFTCATSFATIAPICGTSSGPHTMVCGNWTVA